MPDEATVTDLQELTADSFAIAQRQLVLFTPDEEISSAKLVRGLVPKWSERFGGEPVILPAAEGMLRQIPKIILHSEDGAWRCEISSERISIFWRLMRSGVATPGAAESVQLLQEYRDFLDARVGRMAAVLRRIAAHPNPGLFLARHFCQPKWIEAPFNRPENFELHAHKSFELGQRPFVVNSWVRNKTAGVPSNTGPQPVVLVEQDLNTLAEESASQDYSKEEIDSFFSATEDEFDVILRLYYPLEGKQ